MAQVPRGVVINRAAKPQRPAFRISADYEGLNLSLDSEFWNDTIVNPQDGTTALDHNIATVIQEIRAALYYVGTTGRPH